MQKSAPKRLLWIVNHEALMRAEVPILRSLGYEVFIPKLVPSDVSFRSAGVSYRYDADLTLPATALAVLNLQDFYQRSWAPTVEAIINESFDVLVASLSWYALALSEAARKFRGTVVARVFGREQPNTYTQLAAARRPGLLPELAAIGDRFVLAQSYDNIAEAEDEPLRSHGHTVVQALPPAFHERAGTWRGGGREAVFLCPAINDGGYYAGIYGRIKESFGDLPHRIFGRQYGVISDPAVLPSLSDDELIDLYADAPVFVYPSDEPRHLHYSPVEAMLVGTPVVYRRGGQLDRIAGEPLPGACADDAELHAKALRLLGGDRALADGIRAAQAQIVESFSDEHARRHWQTLLTAERT